MAGKRAAGYNKKGTAILLPTCMCLCVIRDSGQKFASRDFVKSGVKISNNL